MTQIPKQLNIEKWSVDNVCDWLKGKLLTIRFIGKKKILTN